MIKPNVDSSDKCMVIRFRDAFFEGGGFTIYVCLGVIGELKREISFD